MGSFKAAHFHNAAAAWEVRGILLAAQALANLPAAGRTPRNAPSDDYSFAPPDCEKTRAAACYGKEDTSPAQ